LKKISLITFLREDTVVKAFGVYIRMNFSGHPQDWDSLPTTADGWCIFDFKTFYCSKKL
jgi:hypothetical protein